jgi:hypothetical protein
MNVEFLFLADDRWTTLCKIFNAPCVPPDKNAPVTLALIISLSFGVIIFATAVHYAITRLRTATPKEFRRANDRLSAGIPLLVTLRGKNLRRLCRNISSDIIQVTGFTEKHLSRCFHKYYSVLPEHWDRMDSMVYFMRENRGLRDAAIFARLLYFLPLLMHPLVKQTKTTANRYSKDWKPLLERYRAEHPECNDL